MTRYEQWRANPSSVQPQAPASNPVLQPFVAHHGINSHGTNTPTSSSTPSSSRILAPVPILSRTPPPYKQRPTEDDTRRHRNREEGERRRVAEQNTLEQDPILRRQREAEQHAARLGQLTGQNQGATDPVMPVSSVRYPSISGEASTSRAPSGPITSYRQMPLASESPTRCVILGWL